MSEDEETSLSRIPSPSKIKADHHILLVDHTISQAPSIRNEDAERSDSDAATATPATGPPGLYHRLTNNSLRQTVRQEYNKQKYAKYGQDRYNIEDAGSVPGAEETVNAPQPGQAEAAIQKGYLERAQTRAKTFMKRKRVLGKGGEQNTVIEVLYENQRGMFFFGIPKYSSASLLPSDPKPWQNGQFRTSAVDIRNAQVPNPSWEWAWKSWYVDMSRDVDELGWEYSFAFVGHAGSTFAWHGNHPWFHSFVRRRRWLRMRKRKDTTHHTKEKGHELTSDYFTIHPRTVRPASLSGSQTASSTLVQVAKLQEPALDIEMMEISSVGDLFLALRKSTVDREKILAVRKFMDEGGEELFYLSDRMGDIMRTLMFQSSRRQLLSDLMSQHEEAHQSQEKLTEHDHGHDDGKQEEHDRVVRRTESLLKAVHAAESEVKRLEYWSDIKGMTDVAAAADEEEAHNEPSFKNKQSASEGAHELKGHSEQSNTDAGKAHESAYETTDEVSSMKSSTFFNASSKASRGQTRSEATDDDSELERYTTASESTPDLDKLGKAKGKGKARALDGVPEEDSHKAISEDDTTDHRPDVQIVEPKPTSEEQTF